MMKLDLRENMYVRTKDGEIHKIKSINNEYIEYENGFGVPYELKEYIVKASYNIIDILEKGDCVNGNEIGYIDDCEGAMRQFYYNYENPNEDVGHWYEEIKIIITHEQMERMTYKVGD